MAGLHGEPLTVVNYDLNEFDFRPEVDRIVECSDLSQIHHRLGAMALFERQTDQNTDAHRAFYGATGKDSPFGRLYRDFVHRVIEPQVGEPVVYQTVPTFRVHLPGNRAVGEFHKDTDYGHNSSAITWWLPLTSVNPSNAMYVELGGARTPVILSIGQVLAFDSMNILHGNVINDSDRSRVSFDFRIVPASQFIASDSKSINSGLTTAIGEYYDQD